jgi:hypothetical protein
MQGGKVEGMEGQYAGQTDPMQGPIGTVGAEQGPGGPMWGGHAVKPPQYFGTGYGAQGGKGGRGYGSQGGKGGYSPPGGKGGGSSRSLGRGGYGTYGG